MLISEALVKYRRVLTLELIFLSTEGELDEEDLITNDRSVVVVTKAGYIKRMPLDDEFAQTQSRGTRGSLGLMVGVRDRRQLMLGHR